MKKGYEINICRALTKYPTISGIPRVAFIVYITVLFLLCFVYKAIWLLIIFIPLFLILKITSKKDPLFLSILFKYIRDRKYFYGG